MQMISYLKGCKAMLTYASMPQETKRIANSNLGRGVLRSVFRGTHEYHLMLKVEDGSVIGFAVYHFEEYRVTGQDKVLGVLDCVVVDEHNRRLGHGSEMTFAIFKKMAAYGVDRVETMLKEPGFLDRDGEPGVPMASPGSILELLGFKQVKTFHDYYKSDSEKYGYECKFCGNLPDSCKAVLYAKESS